MAPEIAGIGSPQEEADFLARHAEFFKRFPNLQKAIDIAFERTITSKGPVDPLIFYLGMRAVDDFLSIMLLASRGFGLSATALLRGMYERVVTAHYIHENPDEAMAFAEFDFVQRRKAAIAIKESLGFSPENEQQMQELEKNYQRVKAAYEITVCEKCGTKRVGPSWNKLDFVSLVKTLPSRVKDLVVPAYYMTLLQAHSTLQSISALLEETPQGLVFRKSHREEGDRSFRLAQILVLQVLNTQFEHFKLEALDQPLNVAIKDHFEIWKIGKASETQQPN